MGRLIEGVMETRGGDVRKDMLRVVMIWRGAGWNGEYGCRKGTAACHAEMGDGEARMMVRGKIWCGERPK